MEYTEQDAELIIGAVMASASHVERGTPTLRNRINTTVKLILDGIISTSSHDPYALDLVTVARLMREAREQGAAEMRERAALVTLQPDICPVDGPVAAERIRALPLAVTQ